MSDLHSENKFYKKYDDSPEPKYKIGQKLIVLKDNSIGWKAGDILVVEFIQDRNITTSGGRIIYFNRQYDLGVFEKDLLPLTKLGQIL